MNNDRDDMNFSDDEAPAAQAAIEGKNSASLTEILKALSQNDFLAFGVDQVAYVRPMQLNTRAAFAVCGADGRNLSVHLTESAAIAATRASELRLMRIH